MANQRWREAEHLSVGGFDELARPIYQTLIQDRTLAPYAHLRLCVLAQRKGEVRAAAGHALAAVQSAYADPELLELLCKILLRNGLTREALACATALAGLDASVSSLAEVGKQLSDHMLADAALPLLRQAMAKGLSNAPAMQYLLGLNLMYTGKHTLAHRALEASVMGNPDLAPAHWAVAKLGIADTRGSRIDRLRKALSRSSSSKADPALLGYALFHELDKEGELDDAWLVLEQAMRLRRAQVRYDETEQDALFEAATRALEHAQTYVPADAPSSGSEPIFVVGMPRSGTTLIEQHLCARIDAVSAGELRDLAAQLRWITQRAGPFHLDRELLQSIDPKQFEELGQRYLAHTRWRAQKHAHYIDKWPENYLGIGLILASLPNARVICVQRGAMDTCFSNLKEWFAASYYYSYDQAEVARQYARFDRFLSKLRQLQSERVTFVDYEQFVQQPDAAVQAIADALKLPIKPSPSETAAGTISTASAIQVRAGVSTKHIDAWRRYQQPLAPLRSELERLGIQHSGEQ